MKGMDQMANFFESWRASQEQILNGWTKAAAQMQETFVSMAGGRQGTTAGAGSDLYGLYNSWLNSMMNAFAAKEQADTARETASKLFASSNAYMKLYEVWLPLFKSIQERALDAESYKELLDPSKYKDVMDKVFGFSPEGVAELTAQATKLFEALGAAKGYTEPWSQAMQKSMKALPQLLEGRPESIVSVFHDLFAAFDTTVGKVFHVPAVGKDREKVELLMRLADSLSVYIAKNAKYQYLMYATGMGAMDKVVEQVAQNIKEGKEIKGFEEFFDIWLSVSEKRYLDLFQTDDFSRLQGEFLDAALDVRQYFFKLVELYLYDTPIVTRSEMDELYKTIYDLRKTVRTLEKQLKTVNAQEVSA